ncbi:hypothetical protein F5Y19DRAFT_304246 [Xylariaceae sp. FL1651]|nr:hypothetical protein F5Y19DRAFT_304246 [Xylariaceae sp. FL1651]
MSADKSTMATAKTRTRNLLAYSQRQVDRVVSPQTRQKAIDSTTSFASKRPLVSLFIAAQVFFSLLPLLFFVGFVISTVVFALLSALAFSLFWAGIATLFLVPTLLATSGLAVLVWLWAVATYLVGRWVYNKLPVSLRGDMHLHMPGGKQVIFQKNSLQDSSDGFDTIKAEAAEVRD